MLCLRKSIPNLSSTWGKPLFPCTDINKSGMLRSTETWDSFEGKAKAGSKLGSCFHLQEGQSEVLAAWFYAAQEKGMNELLCDGEVFLA